jgi:CHAT domain-containing protein
MPVFYAPSIAVLAAATERPSMHDTAHPALLALANPMVSSRTATLYHAINRDASLGPIPETETEVRAIARIYGKERSRVFVGDEAREAVVKSEAAKYDILHIAAHGVIDEAAPMFSSLVLASSGGGADDGLLEAREIVTMKLGTDLAVLSACETGRANSSFNGAGVIGLSWALLAAGCRTTVVSQWKAQSAATAVLMIEFHRQLVHGASKPAALRNAQLALRRDPRYAHPFYWAPFVVLGAP